MLTCASPLRFVIRTDAIISQPRRVSLPARQLPRQALTLTDRPAMRRMTIAPVARRIQRAREQLTNGQPATMPLADCTSYATTLARSARWHAAASLALILAIVALCAACTL